MKPIDVDDLYVVSPGYILVIYQDDNYGGGSQTFNNSSGLTPQSYGPSNLNQANSCKLYYRTFSNEIRINNIS
jgi:hypothetical protein